MPADTLTRIYELQVKLAQDSLRQLNAIRQAANSTESSLLGLKQGLKDLGGHLAGAVSAGAFIAGVRGAIQAVDDMSKAAERAGISVSEFSALAFAADQADVSMEELSVGLKELQKSMVEFQQPGTKANEILSAMGINPSGKSATETLKSIADQFQHIQDPVTRTNVALQLFGKSGQALVPLLNQGGGAIEALMQRARDLNIVIGEETAAQVDAYDRSMKEAQKVSQGLLRDIGEGLAPAVTSITQAFVNAQKSGADFQTVGVGIGEALKQAAAAASGLWGALQIVGKSLGFLGAAVGAVTNRDFAALGPMWDAYKRDLEGVDAAHKAFVKGLETVPQAAQDAAKATARNTTSQADLARALADANKGLKQQAEERERIANAVKAREQALTAELAKERDQIDSGSELVKLQGDIERGALRVNAAQALRLSTLATLIDKEREQKELLKIQTAIEEEDARVITEAAAATKDYYLAQQARIDQLTSGTAIKVQEEHQGNLRDINNLLAEYPELQRQAIEKENERYASLKDNLSGEAKLWEELGNKIDGYGKEIASTLVDFVTRSGEAKFSFGDFVASVLRDLAKMTAQILIVDPLLDQIRKRIKAIRDEQTKPSGGAGGSNFLGLIGSAIGAFFGSAHGNAFSAGQLIPMAQGGVIARPTIFPMASGMGLMGEAGPEAVLPLARTATGDLGVKSQGAGVTVNVINQSGADVAVESSRDAQGGTKIDVLVRRAVAENFARGHFDALMSSTFGISRRGH